MKAVCVAHTRFVGGSAGVALWHRGHPGSPTRLSSTASKYSRSGRKELRGRERSRGERMLVIGLKAFIFFFLLSVSSSGLPGSVSPDS